MGTQTKTVRTSGKPKTAAAAEPVPAEVKPLTIDSTSYDVFSDDELNEIIRKFLLNQHLDIVRTVGNARFVVGGNYFYDANTGFNIRLFVPAKNKYCQQDADGFTLQKSGWIYRSDYKDIEEYEDIYALDRVRALIDSLLVDLFRSDWCEKLEQIEKSIEAHERTARNSCIETGIELAYIDRKKLYALKCNSWNGIQYKNISEYASDTFDIAKTTAYDLIRIADRFAPDGKLKAGYDGYNISQLSILAGLPDEAHKHADPLMSVRKMKDWASGKSVLVPSSRGSSSGVYKAIPADIMAKIEQSKPVLPEKPSASSASTVTPEVIPGQMTVTDTADIEVVAEPTPEPTEPKPFITTDYLSDKMFFGWFNFKSLTLTHKLGITQAEATDLLITAIKDLGDEIMQLCEKLHADDAETDADDNEAVAV